MLLGGPALTLVLSPTRRCSGTENPHPWFPAEHWQESRRHGNERAKSTLAGCCPSLYLGVPARANQASSKADSPPDRLAAGSASPSGSPPQVIGEPGRSTASCDEPRPAIGCPLSICGMRLFFCLLLAAALTGLGVPAAAEVVAVVPGTADPTASRQGVWPLDPRPDVVSGFDPPTAPWLPGHRGVDLLGQAGQSVRTSLAGTVSFAGPLAGRGVVVVDHGATRTTYEPVSASVGIGELVSRGEVIGTLQRASSHCFPRACLHWGLRRGDDYLNPLTLVGAGPIRLLSLTLAPASASAILGWSRQSLAVLSPVPIRSSPVSMDFSPVIVSGGFRPWDERGGRPGGAGRW